MERGSCSPMGSLASSIRVQAPERGRACWNLPSLQAPTRVRGCTARVAFSAAAAAPGRATRPRTSSASAACLLVLIGVLRGGRKELLALVSGDRESTESGSAALRDLKARGLDAPKLLVAD